MHINYGGSAPARPQVHSEASSASRNNDYHKGGFQQQSADGDTAHISNTPP